MYDRRWARYIRATTQATLARLALVPGERVLDLGCGTGGLLREVARRVDPAWLIGVDLSPAMLITARTVLPGAVQLLAGDATALPFLAGSFGVVVSTSSFHFWPEPAQALAELRRVLRPGGYLVITDWCADYLACRLVDRVLRWLDPAHREVYGSARCGALLDASGFTAVRVERYRAAWPWGMMTATARAASG